MKYIYTIFVLLFTITLVRAQEQHEHACAKSKIASFAAQKSNKKSLNGQEKYDLNYVKLDIEIDNLSTTIDRGHATLKAQITGQFLDVFICELHANLVVDSARINNSISNTNRVANELQIYPTSIFNQGDQITVEVFYHGTPPNGGAFFGGIFNDVSPSWGARVTWTLSQPFSAHTWWPTKQDLTDKIDSSAVWLTVPNGLKAGSNGLLMSEVSVPGGKTRFEWKHQHMIDYYLISLAVGPYIDYSFKAPLPGVNDSVLIQNFIYDNPNTLQAFLTDIEETGDMLYVLSEAYGLYPFRDEKYGHCMAPLSGGMEHQTMTTQGFFETGLTAHELGHQWFGDNVTCETWGHIWVNEGFASYSEYIYYQSLNQNQAQQRMLGVHNNVMSQANGSVFVPVGDQDNDGRIFSSRLTYDKGSALVHMVRHWVNDDVLFFNAMKSYQTTYANGTATAENFIDEIETITNVPMTNFLNHWYYGEGYPTYGGKFNEAPNGIVLELSQTSSMPNVTPFFASHIELAVEFIDGTDTVLYVENTTNNQQYFFPILKEIYTFSVDPDNWVLNKEGVFAKDASLVYTGLSGIQSFDSKYLEMYPNPSDGKVFISLSNGKATGNLYDASSKLIESFELKQGQNELNLNLSSGIYFVAIEINGKKQVEQLLIK